MTLGEHTRGQNTWKNNQFHGRSRNKGSEERPEVLLDHKLHEAAPDVLGMCPAPGGMAGAIMVTRDVVRCGQVPGQGTDSGIQTSSQMMGASPAHTEGRVGCGLCFDHSHNQLLHLQPNSGPRPARTLENHAARICPGLGH